MVSKAEHTCYPSQTFLSFVSLLIAKKGDQSSPKNVFAGYFSVLVCFHLLFMCFADGMYVCRREVRNDDIRWN